MRCAVHRVIRVVRAYHQSWNLKQPALQAIKQLIDASSFGIILFYRTGMCFLSCNNLCD